MRKLITAAFVSLDGVMQAPGGPEEDPSGGFGYGGWSRRSPTMMDVFGEEMGKRRPAFRPAARPEGPTRSSRRLAVHRTRATIPWPGVQPGDQVRRDPQGLSI